MFKIFTQKLPNLLSIQLKTQVGPASQGTSDQAATSHLEKVNNQKGSRKRSADLIQLLRTTAMECWQARRMRRETVIHAETYILV